MNKVTKRLLVFFIGIPAVLGIVFLSQLNHLALHIAIVLFTFAGSFEFFNMSAAFCKKLDLRGSDGEKREIKLFPKPLFVIFCTLIPIGSYLFLSLGIDLTITAWILLSEILVVLAIESFSRKQFDESMIKISLFVFGIFYSGYMITFLSKIASFENSVFYLSLFFILVFMCDSAAWFFGILFGKTTRGIFPASPNKSLVGFIGGIAGSVASALILRAFRTDIFTADLWKFILVSLLTAISAVIGDLIESVLKRSSGVKDSGTLIPGRGGILDSIDSIIVAAPVFYIGARFLLIA